MEEFIGRLIFKIGYKSKSVKANRKKFRQGVEVIDALIKKHSEEVLMGQEKISATPGILEIMQDWSPYMTIHHINLAHQESIQMIYELEDGKEVDIGDLSRFDHIDPVGSEVMGRFHTLSQEIVDLPEKLSFHSSATVTHPFFGVMNSKDSYAALTMHLWLHINQIKKSIKLNEKSAH